MTPALVSIAVTPATPRSRLAPTKQFTATGTYSDASTADLTSSVTWASDTPSVATIDATTGDATGVGPGTTTISATLGAVSGSTVLTVTPALVSIAVTPASPSIATGADQQFTATGTYSDASTADLTSSVTWASDTPSVATIDATTGDATGVGPGTTTISATLGGVSGTTVLTVSVPAGTLTQVVGVATIVHADGSTTPAVPGAPVLMGDIIETSATGAVNILFADNTTFAVSESARMSIDQFVYNAQTHSGHSFFSILQGVFVYISGLIGKNNPGTEQIETPVASLGIRGTEFIARYDPGTGIGEMDLGVGSIAITPTLGPRARPMTPW